MGSSPQNEHSVINYSRSHVVPKLYVLLSSLELKRCSEKHLFYFVHTIEVNGNLNCLVTNILQDILFCVPQKNERFGIT